MLSFYDNNNNLFYHFDYVILFSFSISGIVCVFFFFFFSFWGIDGTREKGILRSFLFLIILGIPDEEKV